MLGEHVRRCAVLQPCELPGLERRSRGGLGLERQRDRAVGLTAGVGEAIGPAGAERLSPDPE